MPKFKNPFAAAAAFAERLSNPDNPLPLSRRGSGETPEASRTEPVPDEQPAAEEASVISKAADIPAPEVSAPPESRSALHQPRILKEYVIPMADDTPEAVTFSSFSSEESTGDAPEAEPAVIPGESSPSEAGEPFSSDPLHRKLRPVRPAVSEELSSNLWALSILLGVVCTVVAFFVGALS